ncbi:Inner centromere protein-related protein [Yarrowia sp. B02]|nr:Inner centromere protein-related protein [Yarrowia sp. B02]
MAFASTDWVQKELGTIRGLVDDNTDDFSYAARRDLEWINEHMDDVLDTRFSLSTLLQTPGRLKGAPSPRKARLMARQPQSGPLSPKSLNSMNSGFRKAVARELEYKPHRESRQKERSVPSTNPSASASAVTIFSDSPDASFHSAEDVTETADKHTVPEPPTQLPVHELPVHELPVPPQEPETEFTFTSLPPREPLTAKTPGSDAVKPSATSLRVQRIRQHLEKSSGAKFSSMIIDGDDDFTKSAAIEPEKAADVHNAHSADVHHAHHAHNAHNAHAHVQHAQNAHTRQLNSPIKLRNAHTGSPSKIGTLYPPVSPSKSSSNSSNTHGHFFSGAIRRAKMLLFQDDKKENVPQHPQTPKQAHISRLMAPTASSSARSPTRSPSKLYPEIRSPTKIPEPRQPASPTRIASPVRVASGASSVASLDIGTPRVLRQPSVKTNSRASRVPVPKAAERFTRRQAEMRKEQEDKEAQEKDAQEREKELEQLARLERERKAAVEREQQRLAAAAEEQRRRQAAAEKEAQQERERKERAERAQRARRDRLLREREERERIEREKELVEREEREKERLEKERLEKERLEKERLEQERRQEELLEEARQQALLEEARQQALAEEACQQALLEEARVESMRQENTQRGRKRSSSVAEEEQQQSQKVHLSNMRKPLSSSTRVSQNHRSSSIMDSPLNKPAGGSLMRQSLQRQYKTGQMGQMAQSRFGKAAEGVMISNDAIKFGSATSASAAAAAAAAAAPPTVVSGAATPLKRVGPNRPLHTTPQQFRTQRTGAFSSSMSFQAKLFKQPSSAAPTPLASSMGSSLVSDPITPAASHVPVTQLPEINSDSDDDEGDGILRDWANSPELRSLLLRQQVMDPDRIFGPLPPLQMEEIFGSSNNARAAKFRGRSSSANWSRDQLSQFEIDAYSEQMGYK